MVVHRKVVVRHSDSDSRSLIQVFADFCAVNPMRYLYLRQQSYEYQEQILADAVMLHHHDRYPFPAIALASGDGGTMHVTNVVPQAESALDVVAYNSFVTEFIKDLRCFRRETKTPLTISCTEAELTLENIIPAARTHRLFERFLALHPTSHHPSDVHRLDTFTCAGHRWCRGRLDGGSLQRYLTEVLRWTAEDAVWCRRRIVTGLDVLEANCDF